MLHVADEAMGELELSVQGPDEIVIAREEIGLREASRRFLEVACCMACTLQQLNGARGDSLQQPRLCKPLTRVRMALACVCVRAHLCVCVSVCECVCVCVCLCVCCSPAKRYCALCMVTRGTSCARMSTPQACRIWKSQEAFSSLRFSRDIVTTALVKQKEPRCN